MNDTKYYIFANMTVMYLNRYLDGYQARYEYGDYIYMKSTTGKTEYKLQVELLFGLFKKSIKEDPDYTYKKFVEDLVSSDIFDYEDGAISKDYNNWEDVKDNLIVNIMPISKVSGSSIYKSFSDIAIVVYIHLGGTNKIITCRPTISLLNEWGKSKDDVFNVAFENTNRLFPVMVSSLSSALLSKGTVTTPLEEFISSFDYEAFNEDPMSPIVITRKDLGNGATSIFMKGVLSSISELLDDNLYIVFTSRHEAMVHKTSAFSNVNDLHNILVDTIHAVCKSDDFLSYGLFKYSRNDAKNPLSRVCIRNRNKDPYYNDTVNYISKEDL